MERAVEAERCCLLLWWWTRSWGFVVSVWNSQHRADEWVASLPYIEQYPANAPMNKDVYE